MPWKRLKYEVFFSLDFILFYNFILQQELKHAQLSVVKSGDGRENLSKHVFLP